MEKLPILMNGYIIHRNPFKRRFEIFRDGKFKTYKQKLKEAKKWSNEN
jgi:hypothetical protein